MAGNNGNPVLAAFDSGATKTTIRYDATQGVNSKIKLLELGPDTTTQGVGSIRVPSRCGVIEVLAPAHYTRKSITLDVLVQDTIVITPEKYPSEKLLNYCVDKLQGIEGYEKTIIDNFQQQLGGNVDILIGEDLSDLHPDTIGTIYDGFKIVRHKAKLYNPNQFLGFRGLFPAGMEPILQLDKQILSVHYEDHYEQEEREEEAVFQETASALQNR